MFKKEALVIDKQADKVVLKILRDKMCGCCANMFCQQAGQNQLTLKDTLGLSKDDKVELGLESSICLVLSVVTFFLPSLVFIVTIYVLKDMGVLLSFLIGVCTVGIYFFLIKVFFINRVKNKLSCRIIRRIQ